MRSKSADEPKIFSTVDNFCRSDESFRSVGKFSWRIRLVKLSSSTWPGVVFNCRSSAINVNEWAANSSKYVETRIQSSSATPEGNLTTVRIPWTQKRNPCGGKRRSNFFTGRLKEKRDHFENRLLVIDLREENKWTFFLFFSLNTLVPNSRTVWSAAVKRATRPTRRRWNSPAPPLEELSSPAKPVSNPILWENFRILNERQVFGRLVHLKRHLGSPGRRISSSRFPFRRSESICRSVASARWSISTPSFLVRDSPRKGPEEINETRSRSSRLVSFVRPVCWTNSKPEREILWSLARRIRRCNGSESRTNFLRWTSTKEKTYENVHRRQTSTGNVRFEFFDQHRKTKRCETRARSENISQRDGQLFVGDRLVRLAGVCRFLIEPKRNFGEFSLRSFYRFVFHRKVTGNDFEQFLFVRFCERQTFVRTSPSSPLSPISRCLIMYCNAWKHRTRFLGSRSPSIDWMKLQTKSVPSCRTTTRRIERVLVFENGFTFESIQQKMKEDDVNVVTARLRKRLNINIGEDAFHHG